MTKKILISPNAFKNSLSAIEVASAIKSSFDLIGEDFKCEIAPISDGGDGTIDVIRFYFQKSKYVNCTVNDPLMRKINSSWLFLDGESAVIELAKASGISLIQENELNPMWANTYGTGELVLSALSKGCKKIILTLGGSATVDSGLGMLEALGVKYFDNKNHILRACGASLGSIQKIDMKSIDKRLKGIKLDVLCDVKNPLLGERGTVNIFSSQKGAKEGEKIILENGMKNFAELAVKITGVDFINEPMLGSAGGVAFSLKTFLNANIYNGFLYLAEMIRLEEKIKDADLIITGEGNLDRQTLMGKGVFGLCSIARKHNKKIIALCGGFDDSVNWAECGISSVFCIKPENMSFADSLKNTKILIENTIKTNCQIFKNC